MVPKIDPAHPQPVARSAEVSGVGSQMWRPKRFSASPGGHGARCTVPPNIGGRVPLSHNWHSRTVACHAQQAAAGRQTAGAARDWPQMVVDPLQQVGMGVASHHAQRHIVQRGMACSAGWQSVFACSPGCDRGL